MSVVESWIDYYLSGGDWCAFEYLAPVEVKDSQGYYRRVGWYGTLTPYALKELQALVAEAKT